RLREGDGAHAGAQVGHRHGRAQVVVELDVAVGAAGADAARREVQRGSVADAGRGAEARRGCGEEAATVDGTELGGEGRRATAGGERGRGCAEDERPPDDDRELRTVRLQLAVDDDVRRAGRDSGVATQGDVAGRVDLGAV